MINEAMSRGMSSSPFIPICDDPNDEFDHIIEMAGGSWGRFQIITSLSFFTIFCVGSQFFYSIPFY